MPAEQRVILRDVRWETYLSLVADTGGRGTRMAYDEGTLEITSPSLDHERVKKLLGRFLEALTLESEIDILSGGSVTLVRTDLEKGLEADECYWFSNAGAVRGRREIDLSIDPPPDLAIEVEISSPSTMKMKIYQALGIPEVWRYRGRELTVLRLRGKKYVEVTRSSVLPRLRIAEVARFLERRDEVSETALVREFVEWARTTRSR